MDIAGPSLNDLFKKAEKGNEDVFKELICRFYKGNKKVQGKILLKLEKIAIQSEGAIKALKRITLSGNAKALEKLEVLAKDNRLESINALRELARVGYVDVFDSLKDLIEINKGTIEKTISVFEDLAGNGHKEAFSMLQYFIDNNKDSLVSSCVLNSIEFLAERDCDGALAILKDCMGNSQAFLVILRLVKHKNKKAKMLLENLAKDPLEGSIIDDQTPENLTEDQKQEIFNDLTNAEDVIDALTELVEGDNYALTILKKLAYENDEAIEALGDLVETKKNEAAFKALIDLCQLDLYQPESGQSAFDTLTRLADKNYNNAFEALKKFASFNEQRAVDALKNLAINKHEEAITALRNLAQEGNEKASEAIKAIESNNISGISFTSGEAGTLGQFGEYFWNKIKKNTGKYYDQMKKSKIKEIYYHDRFIRSPLVAVLLKELVDKMPGLKDHVPFHLAIQKTQNKQSPCQVGHDWNNPDIQEEFLKTIFKSDKTQPRIDIYQYNEEMHHDRWMGIVTEDNKIFTLEFSHGFGYVRPIEKGHRIYNFNFKAPVEQQVKAICKMDDLPIKYNSTNITIRERYQTLDYLLRNKFRKG